MVETVTEENIRNYIANKYNDEKNNIFLKGWMLDEHPTTDRRTPNGDASKEGKPLILAL